MGATNSGKGVNPINVPATSFDFHLVSSDYTSVTTGFARLVRWSWQSLRVCVCEAGTAVALNTQENERRIEEEEGVCCFEF